MCRWSLKWKLNQKGLPKTDTLLLFSLRRKCRYFLVTLSIATVISTDIVSVKHDQQCNYAVCYDISAKFLSHIAILVHSAYSLSHCELYLFLHRQKRRMGFFLFCFVLKKKKKKKKAESYEGVNKCCFDKPRHTQLGLSDVSQQSGVPQQYNVQPVHRTAPSEPLSHVFIDHH